MKPQIFLTTMLILVLPGCGGPSGKDKVETMRRMHRIGNEIVYYADNHSGKYPDKLNDLKTQMGTSYEAMMTHPYTGEIPAWKYVKPAENMSHVRNPSATPILYELRHGKRPVEGYVLFADTHIEYLKLNPVPNEELNESEDETVEDRTAGN